MAIPATWMLCAMLSSPPSYMLRPPMRTLTTHAVLLAATAGGLPAGSGSVRGARFPSQQPGNSMARDVSRHVEEVYVRLGHPALLRRCLKGATQNANESLHSKVWAKCPKTGFVGYQRVVAATCAAIAEFNQGVESTVVRTYDIMAMDTGINTRLSAAKADDRRLQQSRRQVLDSTRVARLARVVAHANAQEADYAPGTF